MSESGRTNLAISVLLPVHEGADPGHLRRALESIYAQSYPADEVVVVEDGPLPPALGGVLDEFEARDHPELRRERLAENSGVARALQHGLLAARCAWVARMDSDDIALPTRFGAEAAAVNAGGYDLVGTAMLEFDLDEEDILGVRRMPSSHDDIVRTLKRYNPFNHPTVLFRRDLALSTGGYRPVTHLEDYDLFARMWAAGARLHNVPEPLLKYRASRAMFDRRRQRGITRAEIQLQHNLRDYGLVSTPRMVFNIVARTAYRLLPGPLMRVAYRQIFRRG